MIGNAYTGMCGGSLEQVSNNTVQEKTGNRVRTKVMWLPSINLAMYANAFDHQEFLLARATVTGDLDLCACYSCCISYAIFNTFNQE